MNTVELMREIPNPGMRNHRGDSDGDGAERGRPETADFPPGTGGRGRACRVRRRSAFTIVELLVVMAIIITLAGLVLAAVGGMQRNAMRKKTISQINAIGLALAQFQRDNGEFPINEGEPEEGAAILYQALSGDGNNLLNFQGDSASSTGKLGSSGEVYLKVLDPHANQQGLVQQQGGSGYRLVDPWGAPYQYIRYANAEDRRNSQKNAATFDLYSFGGADNGPSEPEKWLTNW